MSYSEFHVYDDNLLDFIYSTCEIFPVGSRSISEEKGDLLERERLSPVCKSIRDKTVLKEMY